MMMAAFHYSMLAVCLVLLSPYLSTNTVAPNQLLFAQAFSSSTIIQSSRATKNKHISRVVQFNAADNDNEGATSADSKPTTTSTANHRVASSVISHHVAIKTRNIENAIKFYSLLGFEVESKFVAGPARAAWLLHESSRSDDNKNDNNNPQSRIELIEVPAYMLDESEGTVKRALDLSKREELLGLNHFALDVTADIPRPDNDEGASDDGSACALYQLQQWMDDLNASSLETFGKTLRVALSPTKRIIGREVYEMAFLYDADGTLVELLNHSGRLEQEVGSGWEPWDGKGWVQ